MQKTRHFFKFTMISLSAIAIAAISVMVLGCASDDEVDSEHFAFICPTDGDLPIKNYQILLTRPNDYRDVSVSVLNEGTKVSWKGSKTLQFKIAIADGRAVEGRVDGSPQQHAPPQHFPIPHIQTTVPDAPSPR